MGSRTIMRSKKTKENNQLQTASHVSCKRKEDLKGGARNQEGSPKIFENCSKKLGLAVCAWLELGIAMGQWLLYTSCSSIFLNGFVFSDYSMSVPPLYEVPSVWVSDNFYLIQGL